MGKDNLFAEDITSLPDDVHDLDVNKKKKVNSKKKGNREELKIVNELSQMFNDTFRRVPSSGAFTGGFNRQKYEFTESAKQVLTGDVITPDWFFFSLEIKNYADSPKMHNLLGERGDPNLDKWIDQAKGDAAYVKRQWLLIFNITDIRKTFVCIDIEYIQNLCIELQIEMPQNYTIYHKNNIIIDKSIFFNTFLTKIFKEKYEAANKQ